MVKKTMNSRVQSILEYAGVMFVAVLTLALFGGVTAVVVHFVEKFW